MLFQRIFTAALLLSFVLVALFVLPNLYWGLLLGVALLLAGWEWARLAGYGMRDKIVFCVLLAAGAAAALTWEHGGARPALPYTPAGHIGFALSTAFWIGIAPAWLYYQWEIRGPVLLGVIGCIVLLPCWYAMVWLQNSPARLLTAMGVVWVADTAAYFAGRRFGKRKLAPRVSPGKTWAGVWGGAAAVVIYWTLVWALTPAGTVSLVGGLTLALLMTVLSIVGDLFESWIKRVAGVKDSGTLLPGHGGLLDRVDGLTATMPLAAIYFAYAHG
jgi:phosphatidate cytidylyltransferase